MNGLVYVTVYIAGAICLNYTLRNWTVDGEGITGWDYIEGSGTSPWLPVALWFVAVPWALCKWRGRKI